jgi:hypothetical protein
MAEDSWRRKVAFKQAQREVEIAKAELARIEANRQPEREAHARAFTEWANSNEGRVAAQRAAQRGNINEVFESIYPNPESTYNDRHRAAIDHLKSTETTLANTAAPDGVFSKMLQRLKNWRQWFKTDEDIQEAAEQAAQREASERDVAAQNAELATQNALQTATGLRGEGTARSSEVMPLGEVRNAPAPVAGDPAPAPGVYAQASLGGGNALVHNWFPEDEFDIYGDNAVTDVSDQDFEEPIQPGPR